jgi:hypothetical protein
MRPAAVSGAAFIRISHLFLSHEVAMVLMIFFLLQRFASPFSCTSNRFGEIVRMKTKKRETPSRFTLYVSNPAQTFP